MEDSGDRRRLHNEELHVVYSSPNVFRVIKSRKMKWAVHVACIVVRIDAYRVLLGKPERRRPLGRLRLRWEVNIKLGLTEVG